MTHMLHPDMFDPRKVAQEPKPPAKDDDHG